MKKIIVVLAMFAFGFVANAQEPSKTGIQFFDGTFAQALAKAKAENKLIFLDAYASWCGPCKMLQKKIFPLGEVGDYFNQKFISIKVDYEKGEGPTLAQQYPIQGYPTLFFMNSKGKVVHAVVGAPQSGLDLIKEAKKAK